jgi:hypothetical protein
MATIESEWAEYEHNTVPAGAGKRQRADLRRTFYAGSVSAMSLLVEAIRQGPASFDAMLDAFDKELTRFKATGFGYEAPELKGDIENPPNPR